MRKRKADIDLTVARSLSGFVRLSYRAWDPERGRPSATAAKRAISDTLESLGCEPGDRVVFTIRRAPGDAPAPPAVAG